MTSASVADDVSSVAVSTSENSIRLYPLSSHASALFKNTSLLRGGKDGNYMKGTAGNGNSKASSNSKKDDDVVMGEAKGSTSSDNSSANGGGRSGAEAGETTRLSSESALSECMVLRGELVRIFSYLCDIHILCTTHG